MRLLEKITRIKDPKCWSESSQAPSMIHAGMTNAFVFDFAEGEPKYVIEETWSNGAALFIPGILDGNYEPKCFTEARGDKVHIKSAKSLSDAREMCAQHLLALVTLSQLGSRGY